MPRIAVLATLLVSLFVSAPATAGAAMKGINTHLLWSNVDDADRTRQLDMAASGDADIIRVDVGWQSLQEHGPDRYSQWYLDNLDDIVAGAKSRGVKLLFTFTWSPCWASSAPDSLKQNCEGAWWDRGVQYYAPTDNAAYGKALAFLIRRYGSDVAAWEIWNEPNQDTYWKAPDQAVAYARLVNAAYGPAKEADPKAVIVAGALCESDLRFIERLYAAGMENNFDAFSIHPYSGERSPMEPLSPADAPYSFMSGPPAVRKALLAHGADVPLWFTEFGWSTNLRRDGEAYENGVSEERQAEYLELAFAQVDRWDFVDAALWYNLRDTTSDKYDVWGNAGLHRRDNSPRPAFAAFKRAAGSRSSSPSAADAREIGESRARHSTATTKAQRAKARRAKAKRAKMRRAKKARAAKARAARRARAARQRR